MQAHIEVTVQLRKKLGFLEIGVFCIFIDVANILLLPDFGMNKIAEASIYLVLEKKDSFWDASLSQNGSSRDGGHFVHSGTVPGNPGHRRVARHVQKEK